MCDLNKFSFLFLFILMFQKMKIVPVPVDSYGKFFNGDAYIIYACTEYGQTGGVNMKVNILIMMVVKM